MQLAPVQLRNTVRLSKETLRHWKRVLPATKSRYGRSTAFFVGDVAALSLLRVLANDSGIPRGQAERRFPPVPLRQHSTGAA